MAEPTDRELAERFRPLEGADARPVSDREALEELLRRQYDWILRMSMLHCRDSQTALDCAQEALCEISRNVHRYSGRSEFKTWAYTVARRSVLRARRRELGWLCRWRRDEPGSEVETFAAGTDASRSSSPEEALILSGDNQLLIRSVRALPEKQREAVVLHYFEDLSLEEVAGRMECAVGSVKSHLHRARARLRELLEAER